jgi:hypothetical protein
LLLKHQLLINDIKMQCATQQVLKFILLLVNKPFALKNKKAPQIAGL